MGRRGNQTFLKNQKAQKRVARANAKRAAKQARRDDKAARAASGETGAPIASLDGDELPVNGAAPDEETDLDTDRDDDEDDDEDEDGDGDDAEGNDSGRDPSVTTH
jgi:hypothetical protein